MWTSRFQDNLCSMSTKTSTYIIWYGIMVWYHGMSETNYIHNQTFQSTHLVLTKHYKLITVFYALQNNNTSECIGLWLCVLNHRYRDAVLQLGCYIDCSCYFLYNKAWPHAPSYEFYRCL